MPVISADPKILKNITISKGEFKRLYKIIT